MTSGTPDVHALSGAYALDALTPDEARAFEQHLATCESCRDEVRSLREAASALAEPVADAPPARLRDNVLAGISQVRPLPPVGAAPADDAAITTTAQPDELAARRRRRAPAWLVAVAAALALLAGGAVVRSVQLSQQLDSVTASGADIAQIVTAPDATTSTAQVSGGGRAAVVSSESLGRAVLVTDGMPAAPAGKVWQVWYIGDDGAPSSAGFVPDGQRTAVALQGDLGTAGAVGVTLEPAGGSQQPTTKPVVAITV